MGFWESSLFYISSNELNLDLPPTNTGFVKSRNSNCPEHLGYPDNVSAGYDPRCRPWMVHSQKILTDFHMKANRVNSYGVFEKEFPVFVIPIYGTISGTG